MRGRVLRAARQRVVALLYLVALAAIAVLPAMDAVQSAVDALGIDHLGSLYLSVLGSTFRRLPPG